MHWTAEDVIDANPAPRRPGRSVIERLVETGQIDLEFVASIADEIEGRPQHHVAAFFQLPYELHVDLGWHRIDTLEEGLYAEFNFTPMQIVFGDGDLVSLQPLSGGRKGTCPIVTQVAALFPVWGRRARFHAKYLHHVEQQTKDNPIIIPQGESWIDNRPIFLGDYETNMAKRLIREIQAALRSFLPAYSITALTEAPVPDWLYAYYAMPAPGRVIPSGQAVSVIRALAQRSVRTSAEQQSYARIAQAMTTKFRLFGPFEAQLFAMERLRSEGEVALALIGGISLLEWVLKAIASRSGHLRRGGLGEVMRHASIDFFAPDEKELIRRARVARNALVHEEPRPRRSLTTAGAVEIPSLPLAEGCTTEDVHALLQLAFRAFREANRRGVPVGAMAA